MQVQVANSFGQIASATIWDDVTNLILGQQAYEIITCWGSDLHSELALLDPD